MLSICLSLTSICVSLSTLQAAMIWIIGEYADRINNAPDLLESFVDTFTEEDPHVSLSLTHMHTHTQTNHSFSPVTTSNAVLHPSFFYACL